MSCKSICDKCKYRWSYGGKLYCTISHFVGKQYSVGKKECSAFVAGKNDKFHRGKSGSNRKGRCW